MCGAVLAINVKRPRFGRPTCRTSPSLRHNRPSAALQGPRAIEVERAAWTVKTASIINEAPFGELEAQGLKKAERKTTYCAGLWDYLDLSIFIVPSSYAFRCELGT